MLHELFERIHVTTVCLLDRRLREEAKHGVHYALERAGGFAESAQLPQMRLHATRRR
jgi:hypothetical protein